MSRQPIGEVQLVRRFEIASLMSLFINALRLKSKSLKEKGLLPARGEQPFGFSGYVR
jgi:hypothetical protein